MTRDRRLTLVLFLTCLVMVARTLQPPLEYAVGHWLLDWRHGFLPRGLVGTLITPLRRLKSPDEVAWIIDTLSLGVLLALLGAYAATLDRPGRRIASFAAVTSGWVVFAGHTVGYLDQLVALLVLGAAAGVTSGRPWAALLMAPAVAVHEIAVFFLPLILALGRLRDVPWSLPAVAVFGAIAYTARTLSPDVLPVMEAELRASGLLDDHRAPQLLVHLRDAMHPQPIPPDVALRSLLRADAWAVAGPFTLLAWGWIVVGHWRTSRVRAVVLPLATLAPLGLHFLGWDTVRFTLLVPFAAAVAMAHAPDVRNRTTKLLGIFGVGVIGWHLWMDVPLMQREQDRGGALWPRSAPTAESWRDCREAFANAGFEDGTLTGWTGEGFVVRTASGRGPRPPGTVGASFATSYAAQGDRGTGELVSPEFTLQAGELLVAVEGEVRMETARGVRIARGRGDGLTAVAWVVPSEDAGLAARIVARDADADGHVSIDGVCWFGKK